MKKMLFKRVFLIFFLKFTFACDEDVTFKTEVVEEAKVDLLEEERPYETISQEFDSHNIEEAKTAFSLQDQYHVQNIVLKKEESFLSKELYQKQRPQSKDNFVQGYLEGEGSDVFYQVKRRPLDILLVIDNSGSMKKEQRHLSGKLEPLLRFIKDYDWKIAVTTTDVKDACIRKIIQKGDANAKELFLDAVNAGIDGSGVERGVYKAVLALKSSCLDRPWLRDNAHLSILFVSDEDNCSDGTQCEGDDKKAQYLWDYLSSIREPGHNAKVYGLFWHPDDMASLCPTARHKAYAYADLVASSEGRWGSICQDDYKDTLVEMSSHMEETLRSSFTLDKIPKNNKVKVYVDGVLQKKGYVSDKNRLTFHSPPLEGSKIEVKYKYAGRPIKKVFSLSHVPDTKSLKVFVDGSEVDGRFYRIEDNKIHFLSPPKSQKRVLVSYRHKEELPSVFSFNKDLTGFKESLEVRVGETIADFEVRDHEKGVLKIMPPPLDGQRIVLTFKVSEKEQLSYPLAIEAKKDGLMAQDAKTEEKLAFSLVGKNLVFLGEDFYPGREIVVTGENKERSSIITLPHKPYGSLLVADENANLCQEDGLFLEGKNIDLSLCGFDKKTDVYITYRFIKEAYESFYLTLPELDGQISDSYFSVFIDGVETKAFIIDGNVLTLLKPPLEPSRVKVELHYSKL